MSLEGLVVGGKSGQLTPLWDLLARHVLEGPDRLQYTTVIHADETEEGWKEQVGEEERSARQRKTKERMRKWNGIHYDNIIKKKIDNILSQA